MSLNSTLSKEGLMRILIADDEVTNVINSQMLDMLAGYGSVDIKQNGRDAVLAYVDSGSRGLFHDLVILDQNLTLLDGFATVDMIRFYESEHRKQGKRTMICIISNDYRCPKHYEIRFNNDERSYFLHKPVNLDLLESLLCSDAEELEIENFPNYVPQQMGQPMTLQA